MVVNNLNFFRTFIAFAPLFKLLIKLGDKTILEMVTDKIDEVSDVENIYIVSNEKF